MSDRSKIEWTDSTWNPVRGCTKVSPAVLIVTPRLSPNGSVECQGNPLSGDLTSALFPTSSRSHFTGRTKMIFVNSMSDLFHEGVSDEYIAAVIDVMIKANWIRIKS